MYQLNNFDSEYFLANFWQKKPLVIRAAFHDFIDPLTEHELAGLAQEEEIDARIVSFDGESWQLQHGPFTDFDSVCVGNWSLLVQAVDTFLAEADALVKAFCIVPNWRVDDLMVSYSSPNAGVGPHIDQYDVFIIQGRGSRRWQVGKPDKYKTFLPHPQLRQIEPFTPIIDQVLHTGDVIYIPPGYPHNGVALDYCMNYSIGFRADTTADLLSKFSDYVLEKNLFKQRYQDPKLQLRVHPEEVQSSEIDKLRNMLVESIQSNQFADFVTSLGSVHSRLEQNLDAIESDYTQQQVEQLIQKNCVFYRQPGIRATFHSNQANPDRFKFYIQGQVFEVDIEYKELALTLCSQPVWQAADSEKNENCLFFTQFLTTLVNSGFWYPDSSI